MLVYLDAVEANVAKLVEAHRSGEGLHRTTGIDLKRDLKQDLARVVKTWGWLMLTAGLGVQFAAAYFVKFPM